MLRSGHMFDRYRIVRLIGGGSFGDVYLVEDTLQENKQVALKILHERGKSLQEFLKEIQMVFLQHPHIVPLIGCNQEEHTGLLFLAMEYMPEGTLRDRHPRGSRLALATVVYYVQQIAAALDYAHSKGLVHRDVKPENILIGPNNRILLGDFGIAIISATVIPRVNHGAAGTCLYMAPEQIQKAPVRASDQYALAVIAYEWLAGTPPFTGRSWEEIAHKHVHIPPSSLREQEQAEDISEEVEEVIMQALAKKPEQRFASAGDFACALERASRPALGTIGTTFRGHIAPVTAVCWSPDGMLIASADSGGTIFVWEATGGKLVSAYHGHTCRVECVAWSPNGHSLASSDNNGLIHIWQAAGGEGITRYKVCTGSVSAVAWSPDGRRLASADSCKMVHIWQAMTGTHISTYRDHASEVECVAWSPDGEYLASGGYDPMIQVREVMTNNTLCVYAGHRSGVYALAWSLDSTRLASASFDETVHLWGTESRASTLIYRGHRGGVFAVAWSPQHPYIASGGDDGTVQVWHAQTGAHMLTFRGDAAGVRTVAWSPDGLRLASGGWSKAVYVWQAVR